MNYLPWILVVACYLDAALGTWLLLRDTSRGSKAIRDSIIIALFLWWALPIFFCVYNLLGWGRTPKIPKK